MTEALPAAGRLRPLVHPGFAIIAGATLVSNVGVWMRDTTSAWTVAKKAEPAARKLGTPGCLADALLKRFAALPPALSYGEQAA